MAEPRPCILIPVYNHPATITPLCEELTALEIPLLLVDDGSDQQCAAVLDRLAEQGHHLLRLETNQVRGRLYVPDYATPSSWGSARCTFRSNVDGQHKG